MLTQIRTYIRSLDHEPLASDVLEYALENLDMHELDEDGEAELIVDIQEMIKEEEFKFPLTITKREKVLIDRALDFYIQHMKERKKYATIGLVKAYVKDIRELRNLQEKVVQKL